MSGPFALHLEGGDGDPGPLLLSVSAATAPMAAAILADATDRVILTFGPGRYYARTVPTAARIHEEARERAEWMRAADMADRFGPGDEDHFDPYQMRRTAELTEGAPR